MGAASADDVLKAVAAQQELPYLSAEELPSNPPALKELSPKYLRQYVACPIAVEGTTVTVATADPANPLLLDDLQQTLPLVIKLCVAPGRPSSRRSSEPTAARTAIQKIVEGMATTADGATRRRGRQPPPGHGLRGAGRPPRQSPHRERARRRAPPTSTSSRSRTRCASATASTGCSTTRRRRPAAAGRRHLPHQDHGRAEHRRAPPAPGRPHPRHSTARRVDVRVSTVPTIHGESIVMRLLDRARSSCPSRSSASRPSAPRFEKLIRLPHGIVLVTGPTGSGKTTTLYAALDKINVGGPQDHHRRGPGRVPAQGRQPDPGQAEDRSHLRHRAPPHRPPGPGHHHGRRDPRPRDGARSRSRPSLTGHLVFSTLHTNDAPGAITRLQDMGVEPYLVASVLEGVLAQRLVRRICATCRVPDTPTPADLGALGIADAAGARPLSRPRLRRVSRHRLPRAHRNRRAVPDQRRRPQPHSPPVPGGRDPPRRRRARHGHAAAGRLGQGVRGGDHRRGNPARDPGGHLA